MENQLLEDLYASYNGAYGAHLKGLVEKYGDLKVAEMIINQYEVSQRSNENTDTIGFQVNYHLFWKNVKKEFDKLVCGQTPYEKDNQDYQVMGRFFTLATASSIALTISQVLPIPQYILTPTIALMLSSVMKIGRSAYCSTVR